jgi:hypothetical protein
MQADGRRGLTAGSQDLLSNEPWMKTLTTMLLAGALTGCGATGNEHMGMAGGSRPMMHGGAMMQGMQNMAPMAKGMQSMDANKDGSVSKEEFLAAHGAMFDSMKKNDRGQVAMADMGMCPMMSGARRQ